MIKPIDSMSDLFQDLAARYKNDRLNGGEPVCAEVLSDLEVLCEQGYVIIKDLLSAEQLDVIREQLIPLLGDSGRNNFEGLKTQRIYNLLEKTRVLDELAAHPRVTGLLSSLFLPNYLLSQAQVINIHPGEVAQPLHYDDGFYPVERPRAAFGAATVWAIDEFTADNGATVVIPGSHKYGPEIITDHEDTIPVVMPAGSMVFFLGTLWHGGGENKSNTSRLAVTCQYCEPWLRPQENFYLELSKQTLSELSEDLLSMVGYSIHPPFMGMVNGMHPKRVIDESD